MNLIRIHSLALHCHVGVPDAEISHPQTIYMDLTIQPTFPFTQLNDDITRTIDYAAVVHDIETLVQSRQWRLIETIAQTTADFLYETYPMHHITVEVKKHILPQTDFVSVKVARGAM